LDKSGPMLREARKKKYAKPVSFFNKDLQHFKLRRRYDTAFCLNNTINYLATKKALHDMFGCCSDILKKNSLLILDNCSPHYYRNYYNGRNFSNKCPGFIYNWRHTYKPERKKAVMYFEIVTDQGKYFREKHINILHADTTVTRAAADHFECLAVLDGFSFKKRHARSKEIYYVMRKKA
ncbi:MAG TPA: hypothetical protein VKS21_11575, partial [Spirochaetota bacterium]|nr:hypothetical protein [Spirochaetota bacterium]